MYLPLNFNNSSMASGQIYTKIHNKSNTILHVMTKKNMLLKIQTGMW